MQTANNPATFIACLLHQSPPPVVMASVHLLVPLINTVEREEEVELDGEVEEPGLSSTRTSRSRVEKEEVGKEEKSVYFDSGEGE